MLIERRVLDEGWKTEKCASFKHFATQVEVKDVNVVIHYLPNIKVHYCIVIHSVYFSY